jgi:tRNA-specific 2-thiouridylase
VVDREGRSVGRVDAVELVTVGQRRGLGTGGGARRFALTVDPASATVVVGTVADLLTDRVELVDVVWVGAPVEGRVEVQGSAHGTPWPGAIEGGTVRFDRPQRRVAPGQSVVLYRGDEVVGGGIAR